MAVALLPAPAHPHSPSQTCVGDAEVPCGGAKPRCGLCPATLRAWCRGSGHRAWLHPAHQLGRSLPARGSSPQPCLPACSARSPWRSWRLEQGRAWRCLWASLGWWPCFLGRNSFGGCESPFEGELHLSRDVLGRLRAGSGCLLPVVQA